MAGNGHPASPLHATTRHSDGSVLIKVRTSPFAYADTFAAALAQKYRCPRVTGDPEFRRIEELELDWIGRV